MKIPRHKIRNLKDHEKLDLPTPRLEIRKYIYDNPEDGYDICADYNLVYEHLMGDHVAVRLGRTRIGANLARYDMLNDLPFRDGAHLINEMVLLGMPGYVVFGDKYTKINLTDDMIPNGTRTRLKEKGPAKPSLF